jgi:hypothetical protein
LIAAAGEMLFVYAMAQCPVGGEKFDLEGAIREKGFNTLQQIPSSHWGGEHSGVIIHVNLLAVNKVHFLNFQIKTWLKLNYALTMVIKMYVHMCRFVSLIFLLKYCIKRKVWFKKKKKIWYQKL